MHDLVAIGLSLMACSGPETTQTATTRAPLPRLDSEVSALAPVGRRLAIEAPPHRVLVLDLGSGEIEADLSLEGAHPTSIAWREDGAELAVLDQYGFVNVFDAERVTRRLRIATGSRRDSRQFGLRDVAFAAGGSVLVTTLGTPAEIHRAEDGLRIARISPSVGGRVTALAISLDGELVALGDELGHVGVWSARTRECARAPIRVPRGSEHYGVQSLAFHPDGSSLAIGGGDAAARIWRFEDVGEPRVFSHADDDVFGGLTIGHVEFSAEGRLLATTSFTWWATRVWDVATGRLLSTYENGGGNPCPISARFAAGGRLIVFEINGVVFDPKSGAVVRRFGPERGNSGWANYQSSGGLAWSAWRSRLRVCEVESGLVVLDRATE